LLFDCGDLLLVLESKEVRYIELALLMLDHLMMILILLLSLVRWAVFLFLAYNVSRSDINELFAIFSYLRLVFGF